MIFRPRRFPARSWGFILWFGWFGFNGGSTLIGDGSIAKIVVNTSISGSVASITAFAISKTLTGKFRAEHILNGALGGLVGVTAGCAVLEPMGRCILAWALAWWCILPKYCCSN